MPLRAATALRICFGEYFATFRPRFTSDAASPSAEMKDSSRSISHWGAAPALKPDVALAGFK